MKKETGEVVVNAEQVARGEALSVRLSHGELGVTVAEKIS
jgi:exonuclease VII large subunit